MNSDKFSPSGIIIRQMGIESRELRIAAQHALVSDVPLLSCRIDRLHLHHKALRQGALPIGSVEFLRTAMAGIGAEEPANLSYPPVLDAFLRREVLLVRASDARSRIRTSHALRKPAWFVKPQRTKAFTGFCALPRAMLSEHDALQFDALHELPAEENVWISQQTSWLSEHRYYVLDGQILGAGRYDDGHDDAPPPDEAVVAKMVAAMQAWADAPCAFGLDVGVQSNGETSLVECNDAWALGYYTGTLTPAAYVQFLDRRWAEIARSANPAHHSAPDEKQATCNS